MYLPVPPHYKHIELLWGRPQLVSEKTCVTESASQSELAYERAENVRIKKYQLKESYQEVSSTPGDSPDLTYDRAMQAIDETLQMLKDSADKL